MARVAAFLAISALVVVTAACAGSDDAPGAATGSPGAGGGATTVAVAFADGSTLELTPGADAVVGVLVTPPTVTSVRFALVGEHGDASLEASSVVTDDAGYAATRLHAATHAATFRVRAAVDGAPGVERAVAVGGDGFATITVVPDYGGHRQVASWMATAAAGSLCAEHAEVPTMDGPLQVQASGGPLVLGGIPAGSKIMVTVRSAQAAYGCADVAGLQVNENRSVKVKVDDVPLVIAPVSMQLDLAITPDASAWTSMAAGWRKRFEDALLGGAPTMSAALLDAMATGLPPEQVAAFQAARVDKGWNAAIEKALPKAETVRTTWLPSAVTALKQSPGNLRGELVSGTTSGPFALFAPSSLLLLDAKDGEELAPAVVAWTSEPADIVKSGGALTFFPSRVMAAAVRSVALAGPGAPKSIVTALGATMPCTTVASVLTLGMVAFGTCDTACIASLCGAGIETLWSRARQADDYATHAATLSFAVTADAHADDQAHLVGFDGTWNGTIAESGLGGTPVTTPLKGKVSAKPTVE